MKLILLERADVRTRKQEPGESLAEQLPWQPLELSGEPMHIVRRPLALTALYRPLLTSHLA